MKILKRLLIAILGFIALFLIIAIFVKKEYVVKRDIVINKPKQDVFNYIKFLKIRMNIVNGQRWMLI